jgi:oligopeptide/dipeptide ABC transporter ATP-binding protein
VTVHQALLDVRGLTISFPGAEGLVDVVHDLSLRVVRGDAVGLVGESGSGKSLTSLAIMGLIAKPGIVRRGEISFAGTDLLTQSSRGMRNIRGKEISIVFQEPLTALNPSFTIGRQLCDTIRSHRRVLRSEARAIAIQSLEDVGIHEAERRMSAYPHELSGGMRQRALIAMAIACEPQVLIADEPTTALDVTVQAQIIGLLRDLRVRRTLSILLVSHNLHLVAELCDRVIVMYGGRVMEAGPIKDIFIQPRHPYTRLLQSCVPRFTHRPVRLATIAGSAPVPGSIRDGCPFAPRCPRATRRCEIERPPLQADGDHSVACWYPNSTQGSTRPC